MAQMTSVGEWNIIPGSAESGGGTDSPRHRPDWVMAEGRVPDATAGSDPSTPLTGCLSVGKFPNSQSLGFLIYDFFFWLHCYTTHFLELYSVVTINVLSVNQWNCWVMSDSLRSHGLYPPGSSIHGIFQARLLERVAISFSRADRQMMDKWAIHGGIDG